MKQKSLIAMAIAAMFALSTSALAGGGKQRSSEVKSPSAVSESAPSSSPQDSHFSGNYDHGISTSAGDESFGTGASSSMSGSGSIEFGSTSDRSGSDSQVEYWRMDAQPSEPRGPDADG